MGVLSCWPRKSCLETKFSREGEQDLRNKEKPFKEVFTISLCYPPELHPVLKKLQEYKSYVKWKPGQLHHPLLNGNIYPWFASFSSTWMVVRTHHMGRGDVNFEELTIGRKRRWKSAKNNNKLFITCMNFQKSAVIPETEGVYTRPYPSAGLWWSGNKSKSHQEKYYCHAEQWMEWKYWEECFIAASFQASDI